VTCHASQVAVHDLTFEVSKLGYVSQVCRLYTEDSLWCLAGNSAGDFSVFMISEGVGTGGVFRASVPIGNGALTAICFSGEDIYTGGGDGKVSKLSGGDLQWIKQGEITLPGGTERIRNGVVAMSETPDGTGFVIGTSLGKIFKVSSDFRNVTLLSDSHTAPVTAVAFGAAPNLFATVSQDCSLRVWNLDDYSNIAAAKGPGAGTCCAFIEETVITGWADGSIMANEFDTGTNVWKIPNAHKEGVTALHANPDFIASGGGDKTVRLWGAQTPQNIGQFGGQSRAISGVIVDNQKDNWVHMCSLDKTASTIDLAKEERVKSYQNGEVYTCITQRSSGEREMIVGSASGKLTIWDPDLDKPVGEAQDPSGQCVTCISCSPSGNFAATCGKDGQVKIWDCSVEGELTLVGEPGQGHSSSVCGVAWSPDEKQLVSVGEDCCICVWNFYGA
jgi:WD40 repeat protein